MRLNFVVKSFVLVQIENYADLGQNHVQAECMRNSCDVQHNHSISSSTRESSTSSANSKEERLCIHDEELHREVDDSKDEANRELLEQKIVEVKALEATNQVILKLLTLFLQCHPIIKGTVHEFSCSYVVWVLRKY